MWIESIDVSDLSWYFGSYYSQSQAVYDSYGHSYGMFEVLSFNGYYPMQYGVSYGSNLVAGIFG